MTHLQPGDISSGSISFETAGGGKYYFIMRSVMCFFDNMSKMLYAQWQ